MADYACAPPFFCFDFLGGVTGRPCPDPPYENVFFFSAGFKICVFNGTMISRRWPTYASRRVVLTWNEQRRVSSTLIIAPALSNSPQSAQVETSQPPLKPGKSENCWCSQFGAEKRVTSWRLAKNS